MRLVAVNLLLASVGGGAGLRWQVCEPRDVAGEMARP